MCYSEVSRISKMRILFSAKIKYLQSKSAGFGDVQIDQKRFFFLTFSIGEIFRSKVIKRIIFITYFFHIGNI
jgi:hypothetical protein